MSERKLRHYEKLKKAYYDALSVVEENEGKKFLDYRKKLVDDGCPHFETTTYDTTHDDGYGRWWSTRITKCTMCKKILDKEIR